ncbi:MAG: hypothetical protein RI995_1800 [Bacteroidota bacterium]
MILLTLASCTRMQLNKAVVASGLDEIHAGIQIEELGSRKVIFSKNAEHFFMPASNMKLLTFLVANRYLKEKTPAFAYQETADSLFFWGTGDASFLHPDFKNNRLVEFLKSKDKPLVFAEEQALKPLGEGWAWDDYSDYYSAEISTLPMYGNVVSFSKDKENWLVSPGFFKNLTYYTDEKRPVRDHNENRFYINPKMKSFQSPYITSPELSTQMLAGLAKKSISFEQRVMPNRAEIVLETPLDSLLKPLMYHSDNMIAEQLLVQIGSVMRRSQKIDSVITTIQRDSDDSFIKQIKWVDGSGLSRYNLMRPVDLVGILHAIHQEVPENRWMSLLPQAGKTGTLRNIQLINSELLVWAKSGSFANTYNLSGFARTPKGKWLAFSILSNLANQSVAASKAQVVQFLNQLSAL